MPATVLEHWHPVTHDLGLIRAALPDVVRELAAWQSSIAIARTLRTLTTSFAAALEALAPLSQDKRRTLLVQTTSDWTAYFQNGIAGSDPFPVMSLLAERMQVLSMRVRSTPPDAAFPATIWEVYAPPSQGGAPRLHYRRSLHAANDGGRWTFGQTGEPFAFEDLAAYERPRKRDRFTCEMLQGYLAHFGVEPFGDAFYVVSPESPAVLLERPPPARTSSSENSG
jgi:hypothetical protein